MSVGMNDRVTDMTVVVSAPAPGTTVVTPPPPRPVALVVPLTATKTTVVTGGQLAPGSAQKLGSTFSQALPSAVWEFVHGLSFIPNVTTVDSAGSVVVGAVDYPDATSVRISFSVAFSGTAYCS